MTEIASVPHVLLVEDDPTLAEMVRTYLETRGFRVEWESRGDLAITRVRNDPPDIVILDIGLPGLDGLAVCKEIRLRFAGTIIMLTARGEDSDEIIGLGTGADDYLRKPVAPGLLLARLHAHLRRKAHQVSASIEVGALHIDRTRREVFVSGRPIRLTTAEFDLLWILAQGAGEIQTRESLFRALCGNHFDGLDRTVDLRVSRLRKKLGDDGRKPFMIKSVRGVGYLLVRLR